MQRLLLLCLIVLAAACKGPAVQSPLVGQTRYLCCNFHYEKTKVTDVNAQVGVLVPVGTPVTILAVYRDSVEFQPVGHPVITLVHRYGRKNQSMEQLLDNWFVGTDPTAKVRRLPAKIQQNVTQGVVVPGMTKAQVLMALGYPPAHETPSLESPQWTYWRNRFDRMRVFFDGDKVSSVQD